MRLTYTTVAFAYHGVPMPGVPVLLSDEREIRRQPSTGQSVDGLAERDVLGVHDKRQHVSADAATVTPP